MRSKKLANTVFVSVFLAFICAVAVITVLTPKEASSFYENRALAQQPEWSETEPVSYFDSWNRYFTDHAAGRTTLVRFATMIDLNIIRRPVIHEVVSAGDMYLGYNEFETTDPDLIAEQAKAMGDELKALNGVINSYGGTFYYVAVPGQDAYFADSYPWFLNNRSAYTEIELSAFSDALEDAGVEFIDMGTEFAQLGNPPEFYSMSDYHFTFSGAYETYRTIIDRINGGGIYDLTLLDEGDFEYKTLPNPYMGSRMRKIMNIPGITERTEIAVLNDPILFSRVDNGNLWEAPSVYSIPNYEWEVINYEVYMGGDVPETVIDTGRQLPSILIYGDSFTNPVECFMYYSCGEMRSVDLRGYRDMPLSEYIGKYQPDIVICIRDYGVLLSFDGNGKVMAPVG